ncbi:MAG: hypothetical protein JKY70_20760 [Mucilaginibacter sp.]|nr:hypothetical protein [Mucilaginibacter sp.]
MRPLFILKCIIFFVAFFPLANFVKGQDTIKYFLKDNGRNGVVVNDAENADFVRIVSTSKLSEKNLDVNEYYKNGRLKFKGTGIASTLDKVKGQISYEGNTIDFFPNGKRKIIGSYRNGERNGLVYYYYPEGGLYLTMNYKDDWHGATFPIVEECYDRNGAQICIKGNGVAIEYDEQFNERLRGPVKKGLREGEWDGQLFWDPDTIKYKYFYKNNGKLSSESVDQFGKHYRFEKSYAEAHTENDLPYFMIDSISKDRSILSSGGVSPRIKFVLDKTGQVTKVEIINPFPDTLMNTIKQSFINAKIWVPTKLYGMPVETEVQTSSILIVFIKGYKAIMLEYYTTALKNGIPMSEFERQHFLQLLTPK